MRLPFNSFQATGWGFPKWSASDVGQTGDWFNRHLSNAWLIEGNFLADHFFSVEIVAGGSEGFTWNTPDNPAYVYSTISGKAIDAQTQTAVMRLNWSGGMYPFNPDTGTSLYNQISGALSGNATDRVSFYGPISGALSGVAQDVTMFYSPWTGQFTEGVGDVAIMYSSFTGSFDRVPSDTGVLYCSFRGAFSAPFSSELGSISMALEAIDYADAGASYTSFTSGDTASISFVLESISYTNY